MLTDAEWREAYDYLLSKLHEIRSDGSLVGEVQKAVAVRVEADLPQSELPGEKFLRRVVREELDLAKNRAPTPEEAFISAIEVITTRLRELPAIADRLEALFEREPSRIEWRPDAAAEEFASEQQAFSAKELAVITDEKRMVDEALTRMADLLRMEKNSGDAGRS